MNRKARSLQILLGFVASCWLLGLGCSDGGYVNSHAGLDSVLQKQVVLTNDFELTDSQSMSGASAFLVRYEDSLWAVTAKHLLGENGGIEPAVEPQVLRETLRFWKMYPRVPIRPETDTTWVSAKGMNYPNVEQDILPLWVEQEGKNVAHLVPQFELPKVDDTLYLVGCPYAEPRCTQNVYPIVYQDFDRKLGQLTFLMRNPVDLRGFSGAPILNGRGEVVALMVAMSPFLKLQIVYGTHIAAIQRFL